MMPHNLSIFGAREGFSPQIGTLVSMMNWMRTFVLHPLEKISVKELDYQHDEKSNSVGAMLWHLAATERFYQLHTFEGMQWGDWTSDFEKNWLTPMLLGEQARQEIRGHDFSFYKKKLNKVREFSLQELAKRDDGWLQEVDENWFWGATNNHCKWFHVIEHESSHNGQILWLRKRMDNSSSG